MINKASIIHKLPLPTPYPVGDVNSYLILGEKPALVDTGVYTPQSLEALEAGLTRHGVTFSDIQDILITHGHYDHAGAAYWLSKRCKATLFLHERCVLSDRRDEDSLQRLFNVLIRCGTKPELLDLMRKVFKRSDENADLHSEPHEIRLLRGGERLEIGGRSLTSLHTPGHCPDHLCYLDTETGELFSGDMLLPHITPNPLLYLDPENGYRRYRSQLQYLDSLQTLSETKAAVGYPGHGKNIEDVPALIARNRMFIERRAKLFIKRIQAGNETLFELAEAVFGKLDPINLYLALSESLAYLDLLERDGRVLVDRQSTPMRLSIVE